LSRHKKKLTCETSVLNAGTQKSTQRGLEKLIAAMPRFLPRFSCLYPENMLATFLLHAKHTMQKEKEGNIRKNIKQEKKEERREQG